MTNTREPMRMPHGANAVAFAMDHPHGWQTRSMKGWRNYGEVRTEQRRQQPRTVRVELFQVRRRGQRHHCRNRAAGGHHQG